jgi:lysophospholipase L1-like esterase
MNQNQSMKIQGRCPMNSGALWLTFPLSQVEFTLKKATRLQFRLLADPTAEDPAFPVQKARYAVYLNGNKTADALMTTPRAELAYQLDPEKEYDVRLVKLSECTQSLMALEAVETDGEMTPLPEKDLKIEFIGDSITCGYGVEGKCGEENFTTATENAEKSFAGLTAAALNADVQLNAYSGFGIVSGYTADPEIRDMILVPQYYEMTGKNDFPLPDGKLLEEMPWDFSGWEPQYVVINLGTNDLSWCVRQDRKDFFRDEYAVFLKTVRKRRPEARILCLLGVMGTGLNEALGQAVDNYRKETGDQNIRVMLLEEQDEEKDGAGSNFHPSAITQQKLADTVTAEIRSWMKE